MERFISHPLSYEYKDYIESYRKPLIQEKSVYKFPEVRKYCICLLII